MIKHCLFLLLFSLATGIFGQGSRFSANFAGTASNEHVNFGNVINGELNTSSFTLELWVKPRTINGDPSIVSNKDWDSGNNTGFVLALENGNEFTFNFRPEGGTRRDVNISVPTGLLNAWQHIAVSVDRNGVISLYRNGILGATSANISADAALGVAGTLDFRMAQDGVGNYGSKFDGETDEFRIWNYARTEDEIRTSMCRNLQGTENGLIHYYPTNEGTGNQLLDLAGSVDGTYENGTNSTWNISGAPLGNTSVNVYPTNWDGSNLSISSPESGSFSVDSITGDLLGLHLYRIDAAPEQLAGTSGLAGNSVYFGMFGCNGTIQEALVQYNYSSFTNPSISVPAQLLLFTRQNNASTIWAISNAENNTATSIISFDFTGNQQECILGNIQSEPCNNPQAIELDSASYNSATISWVSGGSFYWNLSYNLPGNQAGSGTVLQAVSQNPYTLTGLQSNTTYEIFVQDTCIGSTASEWVGPFSFTTLSFPGNVAAGTSLKFSNNSMYVSCGTDASLRPANAITYEAWIKPEEFQENWVGIFTNLQDNGTNESGYGMVYYGGKVRAYMMTTEMSGNAWNDAPGVVTPLQKWSHVACSFDGSYIRVYLNGVLKDSLATGGTIDWNYLPLDFRVGMFYDNDEAVPYRGEVDEIRVWNYARSIDEIRTTMCRRLQGNESGLVGYFPLNESSGSTANDGSQQGNTGTLNNMPNDAWMISGAGIGDTSIFLYPESWASQNFSLPSQDFGSFQVALVSENTEGIQIYRVDQVPFFTQGLTSVSDTSGYFGVVVAGENGPFEYLLSYGYGGYTDALADEANLVLFNRNNASENQWNAYPTEQDLNTHQLFRDDVPNGREFYLGTQTGATCDIPSDLVFTTLNDSTVQVAWQVGVSESVSAEFGQAGFSLGTGSSFTSSQNQVSLDQINPNTLYDFYIQNSCSENSQSTWVGPYNFFSVFCEAPVNPAMLSSNGNSATLGWSGDADAWRIQWGPVGFTLGTGVQISNVVGNTRTISGLAPSTNYEFYIRAECGFGTSIYVGPFPFSTTEDVGIEDISAATETPFLYPNPANKQVTLVNVFNNPATYKITSLTGQTVYSGSLESALKTVSLEQFLPGVYLVSISNGIKSVSSRFIVIP
jgi:hypothetical protein